MYHIVLYCVVHCLIVYCIDCYLLHCREGECSFIGLGRPLCGDPDGRKEGRKCETAAITAQVQHLNDFFYWVHVSDVAHSAAHPCMQSSNFFSSVMYAHAMLSGNIRT
jgi:hypothetical protein